MNLAITMTDAERLKFVADCDLADCTHADHPSELEAPTAAVVGNNIVAFAEGVSPEYREDIMNSFLFATLVANKAFNPEREHQAWYARYTDVLSTLGWVSISWRYARYQATQARFTMDEVGLEIIGSAVAAAALPGPTSALMLKVAADAVAALKEKKEPLRVFERQSKSHNGGSFQIASCSQSAGGWINAVMGAVNFGVKSSVTNVLFFEWQAGQVNTYKGEHSLMFNTAAYGGVRELVRKRLGKNREDAISEYEI